MAANFIRFVFRKSARYILFKKVELPKYAENHCKPELLGSGLNESIKSSSLFWPVQWHKPDFLTVRGQTHRAWPQSKQWPCITTGVPSSRYECRAMWINFLTTKSVLRYKQLLRLCMRNKIPQTSVFFFSYKVSTVACNATPTLLRNTLVTCLGHLWYNLRVAIHVAVRGAKKTLHLVSFVVEVKNIPNKFSFCLTYLFKSFNLTHCMT